MEDLNHGEQPKITEVCFAPEYVHEIHSLQYIELYGTLLDLLEFRRVILVTKRHLQFVYNCHQSCEERRTTLLITMAEEYKSAEFSENDHVQIKGVKQRIIGAYAVGPLNFIGDGPSR
jgi:hypothetical protein